MPPRVKKTYKKVIVKRSGKAKIKDISEKKYKRKLKRAIKSEVKGKGKKVTGRTITTPGGTTKQQTISKKKDKGRKKTFVGTARKKGAPVRSAKALGSFKKAFTVLERAAAARAAAKKREAAERKRNK